MNISDLKLKPLVFEWAPRLTGFNPTAMGLKQHDESAYVLIPFSDGYDPYSGRGLWNAVANNKGKSGFASKEDAQRYCEETIIADAKDEIERAKATIAKWTIPSEEEHSDVTDLVKATRAVYREMENNNGHVRQSARTGLRAALMPFKEDVR